MDDIAITGISGRFPKSDNVEEFKQALLDGVDLITDDHDKWSHESLKTPRSMGVVHDLETFDASFFEINPKSAELHDPRGRKLLEVVFESIVDAGFNPNELRGSNTGVFLGIMQNSLHYDYLKPGSGINSMTYIMANNISYIFDFHGPSCGIDTGCSSSIYAINQATESIRLGVCDAAVVCTAHANFLPYDSVEFTRLGVLDPDGRCKTFDDDRNGYVKSEAVVSVLLQKKTQARRIYATIAGVGCNVDGYREDGLLHPSSQMQLALLRDVYRRFSIDPDDVAYVDCHGTGTLVGDIEECEALAEFFSNGKRATPLLIGSVKTNAGHTEAAGGLASLIKIIIALQAKVVPANLNFKTPASDIPAIYNEKLKVVSKNIQFNGGLLAVNSFGLGGANAHLVVKPYRKNNEEENQDNRNIYRLVQVSGRTQEAVEILLNATEKHKHDPGFLTLLGNVFRSEIRHHNYRGYAILNTSERCISRYTSKSHPIWFSYSGMGSQWPQMGKDLIKFDVFRRTLRECAKAVRPYGLDLEDMVLNATMEILDDPLNCFTSIVAVLVGLTDLLFSIGIRPEGIIGHSLGEIGCAYADGLITAEEATLIGYARGWATKATDLIPGLMASVGLSLEECEKLLPSDIFIACDNSTDNVTVSGPEESIKTFAKTLSDAGIFVRIVNTANVAFHSKYISSVGQKFLKFLKGMEINKKPRMIWLPSAVPEDQWRTDLGRYNSSEYQCHNLLNRVLYKQVLKKVPKDAILVEVAPCGLFQAIFRRALDSSVVKLCLVKKHHEDNCKFLLDSVGRLYLSGGQPSLDNLYQKVEYPLGPETPMISPLVKWNHVAKWPIPKYDPLSFFGRRVEINLSSRENKFLVGHVINGTNLLPTSIYVILVWQAFANMHGFDFERMPVIIEKFKVMKNVIVFKSNSIFLKINILKSGIFEISDDSDIIITGQITKDKSKEPTFLQNSNSTFKTVDTRAKLKTEDIYKTLLLRGYEYSGSFKGISEFDYINRTASVRWNKNWTTLLDSLFQTMQLVENPSLCVPTSISKIAINPLFVKKGVRNGQISIKCLPQSIVCNGFQIKNVTWSKLRMKRKEENVLKTKYEFVPYINKQIFERQIDSHVLQVVLQIIMENSLGADPLKIGKITGENETENYKDMIGKVLHPRYLDMLEIYNIETNSLWLDTKYNLIVIPTLDSCNIEFLKDMDEDTFVYTEITNSSQINLFITFNHIVVFERKSKLKTYILSKKIKPVEGYNAIQLPHDDSAWLEILQKAVVESSQNVLFINGVSSLDPAGFLASIKREFPSHKFNVFYVKDEGENQEKLFSLGSSLIQTQLKGDLVINVLRHNQWGSYRWLTVEDECYVKRLESNFVSYINKDFDGVQQNHYQSKNDTVNVLYCTLDIWDQLTVENTKIDGFRLGLDYSGVTDSGVKLMGISVTGSFRTHLIPHENLTWSIPEEWSLKEASTVPFAYSMSYYGLFVKGNLQTHHSILIIYTGNSIDIAAAVISINEGCQLFIATTSQKHSEVVTNSFPKLKRNVIDLSSIEVKETIFRNSEGKGLDIIFFSGKQNVPKAVFDLLRRNGKVIAINFDKTPDVLEYLSEKNCNVETLTVDTLLMESYYTQQNIRTAIQKYADSGIIKPFCTEVVTEINKIPKNGCTKPRGKITLEVKQDQLPKKFIQPTTYFDPEKCYIVLAKLDTFDLEVISWMCHRGAKKLLVNHFEENLSSYAMFCFENLRREDNDITTMYFRVEELQNIVDMGCTKSPIGGIFYIAREANQNLGFYKENVEDEIKNLDAMTRRICGHLDYFVIFLSQVKTTGDFKNDATAVSIIEDRRKDNLPALLVQWGPIEDYALPLKVTLPRYSQNFPQSIHSCLETLDVFMQLENGIYSSAVVSSNKETDSAEGASLIESVAKIFGINNIIQIDYTVPLINLGMDSIMGFEVKNLLQKQLGVSYGVNEIRKLTLEEIKKMEQERRNVMT